jgi:molybdate transport system regulatory protein
MAGTRLTLRVDFGVDRAVGPGKVRLLEAIRDTGSISQAGRSLGMSYRRAWLLVDDLNQCFRQPVIEAQPGGTQGGGAQLTDFGRELIRDYRAIEAAAMAAAEQRLNKLATRLRGARGRTTKPRKTSIRGRARPS